MRSVYDVLSLWLPAVCWHGGKWLRNQLIRKLLAVPRGLTLRRANMGYEKYYLYLISTFYLNRDTSVLELFPVVVFQWKKVLRVDSPRKARDTAAMLNHSRHRGESATKTVKFFVAHTVNCTIYNNNTTIDWMLLNFTPVIQQNCHQPGWKLENHFAHLTGWAVNLSCQDSKTANSEAIVFLIS